MTEEEIFIDLAAGYIGAPYIWRGKGDYIWSPQGLIKNTFGSHPYVFDCSGLVTFILNKMRTIPSLKLNIPDMRGTHSAKTIEDTFPIAKTNEAGTLLLWPSHVAIDCGRGFVLEAAGGDETTLTPSDAARRPNAKVRFGFNKRGAPTSFRRIPLDKSELR